MSLEKAWPLHIYSLLWAKGDLSLSSSFRDPQQGFGSLIMNDEFTVVYRDVCESFCDTVNLPRAYVGKLFGATAPR